MDICRHAVAIVLSLAASLSLVAADKKLTKIKPKEGVVILYNSGSSHISIDAIDGERKGIKSHGIYELKPGAHSIRARLFYRRGRRTWSSNNYVDRSFTAEGGAVLNIVCEEFDIPGGAGAWWMRIEDVATGMNISDAASQKEDPLAKPQEQRIQPKASFAETRKKAEAGDVEAQYNLGLSYETGDGVASSAEKAMAWYLKAAGRGHAAAQFTLGMNYFSGHGVPEDPVEAYAWLSLAAEGGESSAPPLRDGIQETFSPAQLAKAKARLKKLSEEILARKSGK